MTVKFTRDESAHTHQDYFDNKAQARAFAHGVRIGAGTDTTLPEYSDEYAECFTEGVALGLKHRGRILSVCCTREDQDNIRGGIHIVNTRISVA